MKKVLFSAVFVAAIAAMAPSANAQFNVKLRSSGIPFEDYGNHYRVLDLSIDITDEMTGGNFGVEQLRAHILRLTGTSFYENTALDDSNDAKNVEEGFNLMASASFAGIHHQKIYLKDQVGHATSFEIVRPEIAGVFSDGNRFYAHLKIYGNWMNSIASASKLNGLRELDDEERQQFVDAIAGNENLSDAGRESAVNQLNAELPTDPVVNDKATGQSMGKKWYYGMELRGKYKRLGVSLFHSQDAYEGWSSVKHKQVLNSPTEDLGSGLSRFYQDTVATSRNDNIVQVRNRLQIDYNFVNKKRFYVNGVASIDQTLTKRTSTFAVEANTQEITRTEVGGQNFQNSKYVQSTNRDYQVKTGVSSYVQPRVGIVIGFK